MKKVKVNGIYNPSSEYTLSYVYKRKARTNYGASLFWLLRLLSKGAWELSKGARELSKGMRTLSNPAPLFFLHLFGDIKKVSTFAGEKGVKYILHFEAINVKQVLHITKRIWIDSVCYSQQNSSMGIWLLILNLLPIMRAIGDATFLEIASALLRPGGEFACEVQIGRAHV